MLAYPQPRGNSLFGFLIAFVVGGIIGAGIACLAGWICGGGGGGGGGTQVNIGVNQCTSSPNACGLVSIGTCTNGGLGSNGGGNGSCVCDATPPDNSQCPAAVISTFSANPSVLTTPPNQSGQTTLTWQSSNATYCDISGDNGFAYSGSDSGSTAATGLTSTTVFTLTCWDGQGGPKDTKSIRVIVNAHYQEQ